jgi:DNA mismatch repair protein MutS
MNQIIVPDTPMMRQYRDIKIHNMDSILFFRLGDFYEMFFDDAKLASKELDITLTARGKDENRMPMCGIPHHAADSYIAKLVSRGYKVAICEQVEDASVSKGITKRDVVKVITPGTLLAHGLLDEKENNYLMAINPILKESLFGISYADITTGEFRIFIARNHDELISQIDRLGAKEIIIPTDSEIDLPENLLINYKDFDDVETAQEELLSHFKVKSLSSFGIDSFEHAYSSAWVLLQYLIETQKNNVPQITKLLPLWIDKTLLIDNTTIRNLELINPIYGTKDTGTLFGILDYTKTAMGARKLKALLRAPFVCEEVISKRLDIVDGLIDDLLSREEIRDVLASVYDLERLISRIVTELNNPRDCMALKKSLVALVDIAKIIGEMSRDAFEEFQEFFRLFLQSESSYMTIVNLIDNAINDDVPSVLRDGGIIKDGYNQELDNLLLSFIDIKEWIGGLEAIEKERTGIKNLKVRFNKVFGYYIEIPHSQIKFVPDNYIRKQTLTNAERYITPELKEKESILLHSEEKQKELEIEIYREIVQTLKQYIPELQKLANIIAELDCFQCLATAAQKHNYVRPQFTSEAELLLEIKAGRHAVLERNSGVHYIPNDVYMDKETNRTSLITGPNMAGKSTLMRQVALIVVMAQMGSFVPAESVCLSLVDKLFTRIGALDNLYFGHSTFMVEMLETASILHNATQNSLVLLDELGRGTSTFDGMSIAWAVTDYIHNKIGARTLFATHYHELTVLEAQFKGLRNYNMQITEKKDGINFDYKYIYGPADKSYGIHVAKMAGLPNEVIKNADNLLARFELEGIQGQNDKNSVQQMTLF